MISEIREFAEAGRLATYGASRADLWRRSAAYVDKIARGKAPLYCRAVLAKALCETWGA